MSQESISSSLLLTPPPGTARSPEPASSAGVLSEHLGLKSRFSRMTESPFSRWVLARDLLLLMVFAGLTWVPFASWFSDTPDLSLANLGPQWTHPLGTDALGRDLLVRLTAALRYTVQPLWAIVSLSSLGGYALASLAPYRLGLQLIVHAMAVLIGALPIGISVFFMAAIHEKTGLSTVLLAMAALSFALSYLRLTGLLARDQNLLFWQAHHAIGGSLGHRILRYGWCSHWRGELVQQWASLLALSIGVEASLSYLGFGVAEPLPSLGNILASHFSDMVHGQFRVALLVVLLLALVVAVPPALERRLFALGSRTYLNN